MCTRVELPQAAQMHVERIRIHGVPFLFRLFTKCWCYTNYRCFSKVNRFFAPYQPMRHIFSLYLPRRCASCNILLNSSKWRICYWTWMFVDHDIHVCTHNDIHITNFMIHISPTDVSPVLSCICGIAAKILLNSQQLVVLSQSLRSENTHNCLWRWLKGCAQTGPGNRWLSLCDQRIRKCLLMFTSSVMCRQWAWALEL